MSTTYTTLQNGRSVKAVCTSTTESAPSAATEGMSLDGVKAYIVTAEADSAQTLSGTGKLLAYYYSDNIAAWTRLTELDITNGTASVRRVSFGSGATSGLGMPVFLGRGRITYVPSSLAVSSGGVTVYIEAVDAVNGRT